MSGAPASKKRSACDMQESPVSSRSLSLSDAEQDVLTPQEVSQAPVDRFNKVSNANQQRKVENMYEGYSQENSMDTSTPGRDEETNFQGKGEDSDGNSTPQGTVSVHEFSDDDLDGNAAMIETPRIPHPQRSHNPAYRDEDRMSCTKSPLESRATEYYNDGHTEQSVHEHSQPGNSSAHGGVKRARVPGRGAGAGHNSKSGDFVPGKSAQNAAKQYGRNGAARAAGKGKYIGGGSLYMFKNWYVGDRYRLVKILGHGSYGQVAEGVDTKTGQKVAIKRINNVFDQEIDTKRILREVFILRHLRHENVIRLLNIVKPRNLAEFNELYLVFEFVDTDLHKLINSPQYLSIQHIKTFLYQLLCGLKYIHSSLVIHRDIKPANILLNENCSLRICDFGLARVVSPTRFVGADVVAGVETSMHVCDASPSNCVTPGCAHMSKETKSGEEEDSSTPKTLQRQLTKHVVTRWYRPPELILLQDYTNAVDMWSVGCIFAELLSMQKDSVSSFKDRQPLFPGKSCFPLSADTDSTYKDRLDQLNVIFNIIGTPEEHDVADLGDVQHYLRGLQKKPRKEFGAIFKAAPADAIDLLNHMLVFNPKKRLSVEEALRHSFLQSCRVPKSETLADRGLTLGGDFVNLNRQELKNRLLDEIEHYARMNSEA